MLKVSHIYKEYKEVPVLQDVTFELPSTGVVSFVGPNGSGKTTLLNCISGKESISKGKIEINGKNILSAEDTFGQISFFFDESILLRNLSGMEHLTLLNGPQNKLAEKYIKLFQAGAFLNKKVKKYSLGMKQILIIIMTLAVDAPILIFDEALNGLAPQNRQLMMNEIKVLKNDKLIFFSSHILHAGMELSNKIIFLHSGTIEMFDNSEDLNLNDIYMKKY